MIKSKLAVGLALGLAAVVLTSCGGNSSNGDSTTPPGKGILYVLISDTPVCDVLSFHIRVTGLTLTPEGGGTEVSVISSASYIRVNFAELRDFSTVLAISAVPEGTYDELAVTFSRPEIGVYDPTEDPPSLLRAVDFSTLEPTVKIQPALTVVENKVNALRLDLDMLRSLELDAQGEVTGNVTPVLKAFPVLATETEGFGDLNNLVGFVRTVSTAPSGDRFVGSFNVQLLGALGPTVTVNLTADTNLFGTPALNELLTGSFVEIQAFIDSDGNIVARNVEVEQRAIVEENRIAFRGYVNSLTKDADGRVTEFGLHIRGEEPDVSLTVFLDSTVMVSVTPETTFQFSSRDANFADLPFDATKVAMGQELVVHGQFTRGQDQPTTVDASAVYLKLQTVQGSFPSLVQVASDGRSGAFWLTPCCTLFGGIPILVFTTNETSFLNLFGLTSLRPQPVLLVMGLPFYEAQGGTINGISVPPGTLVLLAKQVHQLQ